MSFTDDFISRYQGKTIGYPPGSYVGECLSLVKQYIKERYGINPPPSGCNAARCYWSLFPDPLGEKFKLVRNTADVIPKKGWIPVWNANVGGGYGHIAIVSDDNATIHRFNSFDQNWGGRQAHIVDHDYSHVEGFLVPKEETMPDEKIYTEAEMTAMREQRDENWNLYQQEIQEHKKTTLELIDARQTIERLNNELENCSETTVDPELWDSNGLTIEVTEGNTKTITNYKRK